MQKAFTLIELLVVISIIALLIAILLPVLGAARLAAEEMQCGADQRSLGQAAFSAAADDKGLLPDFGTKPNEAFGDSDPSRLTPYITYRERRDQMEDYGAIRENWYSVTNNAWNRDDFYDPGPGDNFNGYIVFGRFNFTGSFVNSQTFLSRVAVMPEYDPSKQAFAKKIEDVVQFDLLWTDMNRVLPSGSNSFITPGDPTRQGANHLRDGGLEISGSHVTRLDGSTTMKPGREVEYVFTYTTGAVDYWW